YSLQMASLGGIYGLSLWVMLVNLLTLNLIKKHWPLKSTALWTIVVSFPYLYGFVHYHIHSFYAAKHPFPSFKTLLVQTAFPIEETLGIKSQTQFVDYVFDEWNK